MDGGIAAGGNIADHLIEFCGRKRFAEHPASHVAKGLDRRHVTHAHPFALGHVERGQGGFAQTDLVEFHPVARHGL